MVSVLSHFGYVDEYQELLRRMHTEGVDANHFTVSAVIRYALRGRVTVGLSSFLSPPFFLVCIRSDTLPSACQQRPLLFVVPITTVLVSP